MPTKYTTHNAAAIHNALKRLKNAIIVWGTKIQAEATLER
jgi:hypothetical protein